MDWLAFRRLRVMNAIIVLAIWGMVTVGLPQVSAADFLRQVGESRGACYTASETASGTVGRSAELYDEPPARVTGIGLGEMHHMASFGKGHVTAPPSHG